MASNVPTTCRVASSSNKTHRAIADSTSNLDIFIRNLRLLDLDLLLDSPKTLSEAFSSNNAQRKDRIRNCEWALYRLFEVWDKKATYSQLRPFFPPLVPLQSLNLRAAIYRWINELKRDGVLPKECVIRKSSLDECKGERFEEILMFLSAMVLRKVTDERQDSPAGSEIFRRQAVGSRLASQDTRTLNALIMAHKMSLVGFLLGKDSDRERIKDLERTIALKESASQHRLAHASNSMNDILLKTTVAGIDLEDVQSQVREHWPEGDPWLETMLNVDKDKGRDRYLEDSFEHIWEIALSVNNLEYEGNPNGLITNLQSRIDDQQVRLERWRAFQSHLSTRMQVLSQTPRRTPAKSIRSSPLKSPIKSAGKPPSKMTSEKTSMTSIAKTARNVTNVSHQLAQSTPNSTGPTKHKYLSTNGAGFSRKLALEARVRPHSVIGSDLRTLSVSEVDSSVILPVSSTNGALRNVRQIDSYDTEQAPSSHKSTASVIKTNEVLPAIDKSLSPIPLPAKLSLAERTQKTLALAHSQLQRGHSTPPSKNISETRTPELSKYSTAIGSQNREFVSLAQPPAPGLLPARDQKLTSSPIHGHRKSNSVLVGATPSPGEMPSFNIAFSEVPDSRISTPVNSRFYPDDVEVDDTDCASVFKSRPKLKTSPAGSEQRISPIPWTRP